MQPKTIDVGRRQFLKLSSVAIATAAVAPKLFAGDAAGDQPTRLAVGFIALDGLDQPATRANGMGSSDGAFISRGARVTVVASGGVRENAPGRRVGELCAFYSYFDGASMRQAPFCAAAATRVAGESVKSISFNVPIDLEQKLSFTITGERQVAAAGTATGRFKRVGNGATQTETSVLPVTFALRNEPGAIALSRGYFVIAPLYAGDEEPRWSSHALRQLDGRWTLVDESGTPAAFEHFVLRIDYARGEGDA